MSLVTYRNATTTLDDYDEFNNVELKCFGENYYSFYQYASIVSQGLTYFAEKNGEVIGYIICINKNFMVYTDDDEYEIIQSMLKNKENLNCIQAFSFQDKKYIHIFGFGVLAEHRGLGIGNKLMSKILKHQKKYKQSIVLEVRISNINAIRLYKKFGFETATTIPDYYIDNHEACYLFIRPYNSFFRKGK